MKLCSNCVHYQGHNGYPLDAICTRYAKKLDAKIKKGKKIPKSIIDGSPDVRHWHKSNFVLCESARKWYNIFGCGFFGLFHKKKGN